MSRERLLKTEKIVGTAWTSISCAELPFWRPHRVHAREVSLNRVSEKLVTEAYSFPRLNSGLSVVAARTFFYTGQQLHIPCVCFCGTLMPITTRRGVIFATNPNTAGVRVNGSICADPGRGITCIRATVAICA